MSGYAAIGANAPSSARASAKAQACALRHFDGIGPHLLALFNRYLRTHHRIVEAGAYDHLPAEYMLHPDLTAALLRPVHASRAHPLRALCNLMRCEPAHPEVARAAAAIAALYHSGDLLTAAPAATLTGHTAAPPAVWWGRLLAHMGVRPPLLRHVAQDPPRTVVAQRLFALLDTAMAGPTAPPPGAHAAALQVLAAALASEPADGPAPLRPADLPGRCIFVVAEATPLHLHTPARHPTPLVLLPRTGPRALRPAQCADCPWLAAWVPRDAPLRWEASDQWHPPRPGQPHQ